MFALESLQTRVQSEVGKAVLQHDEGHGGWCAIDSRGDKYEGSSALDALQKLEDAWTAKYLPQAPAPVEESAPPVEA